MIYHDESQVYIVCITYITVIRQDLKIRTKNKKDNMIMQTLIPRRTLESYRWNSNFSWVTKNWRSFLWCWWWCDCKAFVTIVTWRIVTCRPISWCTVCCWYHSWRSVNSYSSCTTCAWWWSLCWLYVVVVVIGRWWVAGIMSMIISIRVRTLSLIMIVVITSIPWGGVSYWFHIRTNIAV